MMIPLGKVLADKFHKRQYELLIPDHEMQNNRGVIRLPAGVQQCVPQSDHPTTGDIAPLWLCL